MFHQIEYFVQMHKMNGWLARLAGEVTPIPTAGWLNVNFTSEPAA
jgi:hypothetical protein